MHANRFRIALSLAALLTPIWFSGGVAYGQETLSPATQDPAAAATDPSATQPLELSPGPSGSDDERAGFRLRPLDPPPTTAPAASVDPAPAPATPDTASVAVDPAASASAPRPKITADHRGWHPIQVFVQGDGARADLVQKLNAARFDAVDVPESESSPAFIAVAPIPDASPEESERRLREIVGRATIWGGAGHTPPPPGPDVRAFSSFKWSADPRFKWKPGGQRDNLDRVVDALAESGLPIEYIQHDQRPDGSNWVTLIYEPEAVAQIEAFVLQNVENVTLWPPRPVTIGQPHETETPEAPASQTVEVKAEPPSPPFAAKVLLIETDWEKANQPDEASRLARSLANGVVETAGKIVFPPSYAAMFAGAEARTVSDDLQRLGLVRQSMPLSSVDLKLSDKHVETLGAVTLSFSERTPDGRRERVVWNLLLVTEPLPERPRPFSTFQESESGQDAFAPGQPATKPAPRYRVAVVGWKARTSARLQAQGTVEPLVDVALQEGEESERYVGSFILGTDQSAIVPLAFPGLEGAVIVINPASKGPKVRSLGPRTGVLDGQALDAEFSIDWNELIHAYQSSPVGVAGTQARTIEAIHDATKLTQEEATADITMFWRPAKKDQVDLLEKSLKELYPDTRIVLTQSQGEQGATLVVRAPASSAEELAKEMEALAAPLVPVGATITTTISAIRLAEEAAEDEADEERTTLVLRLEHAKSDDVAKLLDALKLDPAIRLVSDPRTNSILLSAPPATKYKHVQAVIDLLKELDRPAEATPAAEKIDSTPRPDRAANVANLRSELARVEADVQKAAGAAQAASASERSKRVDELRRVVSQAFDLRLKLQREEAAELRDRLAKIEDNLARRERIQRAVIDRRVEVLLDPAIEWPEVAEENSASPARVAGSPASADLSSSSTQAEPFDLAAVSSLKGFTGAHPRGDAFAAATSLALQISELSEQAKALGRAGAPDGSEVKLALIQRQAQLLRQEFEARAQAIDQEAEAAKAKVAAAEARCERVRTLHDTGDVSLEEVAQAEADLRSAKAERDRQEILRRRYDEARSAMDQQSPASAFGPAPPSPTGRFVPDPASWAPLDRVPAVRSSRQRSARTDPSTAGTTTNEEPVAPLKDSGVVPELLQGVWRTVRSISGGRAQEYPTAGISGETEWRFYGPYAFVHYEDDDTDSVSIYRVVVDPSATPSRMELHPVGLPFEDYAHIENIRPTHYLYEVDFEGLLLASRDWDAHPELGYPEKIAPTRGVSYLELERVSDAEAIVPVDEGAPAGNRQKWTRPNSMNIESWRRDDQFSIATSLALRLAELARRIRTLEEADGPSKDEDALASAQSSFDLLGEEFDARERAAQRQLATAAQSLKISEARLRTLQQADEAGKDGEEEKANAQPFGGASGNAQADVQSQREEVAFLDALVGHYARARATFESASPGSGDAPAEGAIYGEFEPAELRPDSPLVPTESQEAVAEPALVQQARQFAESLKAKEQAIQEKKDHYASISPADATAPGVKKTIVLYESEAEALRDRLRELDFFAQRMADAARERADEIPSDDEERRPGLENEAHRFAEVAETVREVVTSAGVETKPDWRPSAPADEFEPWEGHRTLHDDYRRARERQKNSKLGSDERRLAQERVDYIVRTARDVSSRTDHFDRYRQNLLTRAQDAYFAAEKKLEETRSRVATRDEIEAAEFELARNAYVVERTRQILDAVAKREAEFDALFRDIASDAAKGQPLKLDDANAPQSESEEAPEVSSSTRTSEAVQPVEEPEEVLAP